MGGIVKVAVTICTIENAKRSAASGKEGIIINSKLSNNFFLSEVFWWFHPHLLSPFTRRAELVVPQEYPIQKSPMALPLAFTFLTKTELLQASLVCSEWRMATFSDQTAHYWSRVCICSQFRPGDGKGAAKGGCCQVCKCVPSYARFVARGLFNIIMYVYVSRVVARL